MKSGMWHSCSSYVSIFTIEKAKITKNLLDKKAATTVTSIAMAMFQFL